MNAIARNLEDFNMTDYVKVLHPVSLAYLAGTAELALPTGNEIKGTKEMVNKISKSVESICNFSNVRLIFPLHLRESITLYSMTGTRIGLTLLASSSPYPSYKFVRSWLEELAGSKSGDVVDCEGDILILRSR